jgi:hypothetical protein
MKPKIPLHYKIRGLSVFYCQMQAFKKEPKIG